MKGLVCGNGSIRFWEWQNEGMREWQNEGMRTGDKITANKLTTHIFIYTLHIMHEVFWVKISATVI